MSGTKPNEFRKGTVDGIWCHLGITYNYMAR